MINHDQVWAAIDALARRLEMSPSGLARQAGLDPTTFNPSKRFAGSGVKARWPSTESIAKVLNATGTSFEEFAALASRRGPAADGARIPLTDFERIADEALFDDAGAPVTWRWRAEYGAAALWAGAYALRVTTNAFAPAYRRGDHLIVRPVSDVEVGRRALVKPRRRPPMVVEVRRSGASALWVAPLDAVFAAHAGAGEPPTLRLARGRIAWVARIAWVSQ